MGALPVASSGGVGAAITALVAVVLIATVIVAPFIIWGRRRRIPDPTDDARPQPEAEEVEPNVMALFVAVGAAFLGIVSVFLPALESETFSTIKHNALIQSGTGFFIIGVCLAILGSAYRVYQSRTKSWTVCVGGVALIAAAIYAGTGKRAELEGTLLLTGQAVTAKASPAIGIYAVGAAGAIALFAGYAIATNRGTLAPAGGRSTKTCPDCAESVLSAARICKHCGHEFDPETTAA